MKSAKKSNAASVQVISKNELNHEDRILNALTADELEELFQQQEPGLITVLGKFRVTPMLYQLVAAQLEAVELTLIEDVEYTPAELMGDEVWFTFGPEGQREMELCLKQFALNDKCPLVDTGIGIFVHI